jgi:hypothetical protein
MHGDITRRRFAQVLVASTVLPLASATALNAIGHAGIIWVNDCEEALANLSVLSYRRFEIFVSTLEPREQRGGLQTCGRMLQNMGLTALLNQHTGTAGETRDEPHSVLDAVDTRYERFGPDIGKLKKGGTDPLQMVKDYLTLLRHMDLKDCGGSEHFFGYCPLGQGRVDIPTVPKVVANANRTGHRS